MKPSVSFWKWISGGAVCCGLLGVCVGVGGMMCLLCETQSNGVLCKKAQE